MGQVLHGSVTTTQTVRRAIQNSQARELKNASQALRHQSKNLRKMEETYFSR